MSHARDSVVTLAHQQFGSGPDIVLLHGLGANRAFWIGPLLQFLQRHLRVTLFDLRGHGYSAMPASGYAPPDMARDLAGLIASLGLRRPLLLGHSYGGQVALQLAASDPELVGALVVLDTRMNCFQPPIRLSHAGMLSPFEQALIRETTADFDWRQADDLGLAVLEQAARAQPLRERLAAQLGGEFVPFQGSRRGQRAARRWLRLLEETSARQEFLQASPTEAQLCQIRHPVLLAYGENSRCRPSMQALEACLPRSESYLVPQAGHMFPISRPRVVVRLLRAFLRRYPPPYRQATG